MKLLVVLVATLIIFQVESAHLKEGIEDKCIEEYDLNEQDLKATVQEPDTPEDDEDFGKFYACLWKGRGVMKDDGSISPTGFKDFIIELFPQPVPSLEVRDKIVTKIVNRCENVKGESEGQIGIKLKNCMVESVREIANNKLEKA